MPRSPKSLSPKPAKTKKTTSRAKKTQARSSAGATAHYPWNARFPAKNRDAKHEIVFRSRQMRLLEQVGGAAQAEIFFSDDDTTPLALQAQRLVTEAICSKDRSTALSYDARLRSFENFCLSALPDGHVEKKRIQRIDQALAQNEKTFRLTENTSPNAWMQYVAALKAPATEKFTFCDGGVYHGRGVGWKVVEGAWNALKWADETLTGMPTRLRMDGVRHAMQRIRSTWVPESAKAFDVAETLPRLHDALFVPEYEGRANPFNSSIMRQEVHAMFYAKLSCCARRSLFTTYSPRIDQVEFSEQVDADGVPRYYTIELERWKGNRDGLKKQKLLIKRNRIALRYCPVVAMMMWFQTLESLGVENGPLFPALDDSHNNFRRDKEGNILHMTGATWSRWWDSLATYVGGTLSETTTHSLRRSVVKWAARCGARELDVVEAGRWEDSSGSFKFYWKDGSQRRVEMDEGGTSDPVLRVWKWVPTVYRA